MNQSEAGILYLIVVNIFGKHLKRGVIASFIDRNVETIHIEHRIVKCIYSYLYLLV